MWAKDIKPLDNPEKYLGEWKRVPSELQLPLLTAMREAMYAFERRWHDDSVRNLNESWEQFIVLVIKGLGEKQVDPSIAFMPNWSKPVLDLEGPYFPLLLVWPLNLTNGYDEVLDLFEDDLRSKGQEVQKSWFVKNDTPRIQ